ncbi:MULTISPECIES: hypothetical protein [unclassified Variovorax]|uniref:hypothetical protein n=1 Tax=unclassified Variovorax TaxID=663243 RepID=UPI003ECF1709
MLADVDRARQATKQLEGDLSKEQQRRVRGEEAAAELLDAERQALRDVQQSAQQTERALRDQLAAQGIALAQAQSQGSALQQRLDDLQGAACAADSCPSIACSTMVRTSVPSIPQA